jgi:hypothetical protein
MLKEEEDGDSVIDDEKEEQDDMAKLLGFSSFGSSQK